MMVQALQVIQVLAAGKELLDLFTAGEITEEQMMMRWAKLSKTLPVLEEEWYARQQAKKTGKISARKS